MRVLEHFSTYQKLPILIDEIADFIIEKGYVYNIAWHPTDEDGEYLAGMLYQTKYSMPYFHEAAEIAHIVYNTNSTPYFQRVVCAKELLHICDSELAAARTAEVVDKQVADVLIPKEIAAEMISLVGVEAKADISGTLRAIALLFPIEARETLMPAFENGSISIDEISKLVEIPIAHTTMVMADDWPKIYELITKTMPALSK